MYANLSLEHQVVKDLIVKKDWWQAQKRETVTILHEVGLSIRHAFEVADLS